METRIVPMDRTSSIVLLQLVDRINSDVMTANVFRDIYNVAERQSATTPQMKPFATVRMRLFFKLLRF